MINFNVIDYVYDCGGGLKFSSKFMCKFKFKVNI
jgi:hypothetical protein